MTCVINSPGSLYLWIVKQGYKRVWKPRSKAAISVQRTWNINKKDKNPNRSKRKNADQPLADMQTTPAADNVQVRVATNFDRIFDAHRCRCGTHSLVHQEQCNVIGLRRHRARTIVSSHIFRQTPYVPFVICRSIAAGRPT